MEMLDPNSAVNAEEQPVIPVPEQESSADEPAEIETTFETTEGIDPEEAVEDVVSAEEGRDAVLAALKAVLEKEASEISADDIRRLRQQISTVHQLERRSEEAEEETAEVSEDEELKSLFNQIREKKAEYTAKIEAERVENFKKKQAIIDEILALADDTDNVGRTFPRYRELQEEFNATGEVPASEQTGIWNRYNEARNKYSDQLNINKELRDYDFKKNLDSKTLIIDEAEKLAGEEDVIVAYRRLQDLHDKWRQIGPVAKEFREEIWERFKAASTEINKRYQSFFEARKAVEAENEAAKNELCNQLEALMAEPATSYAGWDSATKAVIEIQEKWRTLGFASRKANRELYARYRALCDKFFAEKAAFFQSAREELASNLEKKTALVEKAEALKDSTEWRATADTLVELQKQWKQIGPVAKKYSDALWQRFQQACDAFFEAKKKDGSGKRKEESENLKAKRALIDELDKINAETPREEAISFIREIQERWKTIGHVPFREKDKVYEAFRQKLDAIRSALDLRRSRDRMEQFTENIDSLEGDSSKMGRERERLARALESRRQELRTYENNLGFLSSKSKNGEGMMREFERKAERLRTDIADLEQKIKLIDSRL